MMHEKQSLCGGRDGESVAGVEEDKSKQKQKVSMSLPNLGHPMIKPQPADLEPKNTVEHFFA